MWSLDKLKRILNSDSKNFLNFCILYILKMSFFLATTYCLFRFWFWIVWVFELYQLVAKWSILSTKGLLVSCIFLYYIYMFISCYDFSYKELWVTGYLSISRPQCANFSQPLQLITFTFDYLYYSQQFILYLPSVQM